MSNDRQRCEAMTKRGSRCKRDGGPCVPDAKGLRYICAQHWCNLPDRWAS